MKEYRRGIGDANRLAATVGANGERLPGHMTVRDILGSKMVRRDEAG